LYTHVPKKDWAYPLLDEVVIHWLTTNVNANDLDDQYPQEKSMMTMMMMMMIIMASSALAAEARKKEACMTVWMMMMILVETYRPVDDYYDMGRNGSDMVEKMLTKLMTIVAISTLALLI
jgi:hypothetical protein